MRRPPSAPNPASVEAYIAAAPFEARAVLEKIRAIIRAAQPRARERISYGMPTWDLPGGALHVGAFKTHIGLFPPVREPGLQDRVAPYRGEKGNLRFPLDRDVPYDLIADIVAARANKDRT